MTILQYLLDEDHPVKANTAAVLWLSSLTSNSSFSFVSSDWHCSEVMPYAQDETGSKDRHLKLCHLRRQDGKIIHYQYRWDLLKPLANLRYYWTTLSTAFKAAERESKCKLVNRWANLHRVVCTVSSTHNWDWTERKQVFNVERQLQKRINLTQRASVFLLYLPPHSALQILPPQAV